MAFALVQSDKKSVGTQTTTLSFPGSVTSGNLLLAGVCAFNSIAPTGALASPTDGLSGGTSFSAVGTRVIYNTSSANTERLNLFYFVTAATGADTISFNWDVGGTLATTVFIAEFSGNHASPFGTTDSAVDNTGSTTAVTPSIVCTNGQLLIGLCSDADGSNPTTYTEGASYTNVQKETNGAANQTAAMEYRVVGADGSYTAGYTVTSSRWGILVASFTPSSPPPPPGNTATTWLFQG